jgi:hypothetical protein
MSGPIVRSGPSSKFSSNWEKAFGGKKAAKKTAAPKAKAAKKKASKKKATKKSK